MSSRAAGPTAAPPPESADPAPGTPRWLRHPVTRVLLVVVLFVAVLAAAALAGSLAAAAVAAPGPAALVDGVVAALVGIAVYALAVRLTERRPVVELDVRAAPLGLLRGIAWGAGLFTLVIGAIAATGGYRVTGTGSTAGVLVLLGLSVSSGVVEELAFRGVLFRVVEGLAGTWVALAVSAVAFGGVHLTNPDATLWGAVAIAVEAGLLLAAAYVVTRRLWMPIGLHAAWNFTQGGVFGVPISGSGLGPGGLLRGELSGPALLSGGSFGAEASVFAVVVGAAAAAFLLRRAARAGQFRAPAWRRPAERRERV